MDFEKSLNSDLLEEVFNEVEGLEAVNATKLGLLENLIHFDKKSSNKDHKNMSCLQDFNFLDNVEEKESVVHEGLTDSSEDEDNKYFEDSNYNECGKTLKTLIKRKNSSTPQALTISKVTDLCLIGKGGDKELAGELERFSGTASQGKGPVIQGDPILGMNIINPLISSTVLKEKLMGRVSISTTRVKQFLNTSAVKDSNWVTGGAIVSKLTRTSQKGNQYCVWHLTDLRGDIKTVCVFLFGSAYKEYWKTSLGTVVGILNPVVMENKENSEATLRIDNAQKVLVIGMSKDYGTCRSKKKNGENCYSVVNKSKCEYCVFHVKKEYNKACRRTDLQPPNIGRNLDSPRTKIQGKNRVFNGAGTFDGKNISKLLEKDEQRLKLLSQPRGSAVETKLAQKQRDESTKMGLNQNPNKILLRMAKEKFTPTLPKPENQMIDLQFTLSKKERNAAKINALRYVREHGPLKKLVDGTRVKKTPEQISSIKRKLNAEEEKEKKKMKMINHTPINSLKDRHIKSGITDEFIKLMNSGTQNNDLVKLAESEEREKYFGKLEIKEKLENKMASTFKVECKAVRCLKCNYKTFSASDICKKEKHPLKVVNAIKRFWKCGNCMTRTVCLELVPLYSCKVCGSSKWERASMMPERKDANLNKIPLSIRGDEEKFLGVSNEQANLNLLVPEDSS